MDHRGVLIDPQPWIKDKAGEIDFLPTLLEFANRDWVQNSRSGPFARLAEAISGIYTAKPNVFERDRSIDSSNNRLNEAERDKLRTGDTSGRIFATRKNSSVNSVAREISEEYRGQEQSTKSLSGIRGPSQLEKHTQAGNNVDRRLKDRKVSDLEMGKGEYPFADAYSAAQSEGEERASENSSFSLMAVAERSLQIKLMKSVLSQGINTPTVEEMKRQTVQEWKQSENTWEYVFSREPIPDLVSRSSLVQYDSSNSYFETALQSCLPTGIGATASTASFGPIKVVMRKLPLPLKTAQKEMVKNKRTDEPEIDKASKLRKLKYSESTKKGQIKRARIVKQLLCGGIAGVISRTAVAPIDLIKTHLITSHGLRGAKKSALTICTEIIEQSGWKGLFRGNLVNCIRVAPNKAIELCVFEMVRRALNKEGHPLKNLAATIAGGAAGMAGTIATYPLELIRTRLSVQPELYSGLLQAVSKIVRDEGFVAFYSGLSPSLVGVFPYAATNYFVYDGLRTTYCRSTGQQNVPTIPTLVFGAVAAAASSSVTYPLEVARRQMQLCLTDTVAKQSTIGVILEIYRHEGFFALYRGLGTTWLKLIPAAGISFMCYEAARLALHIDDASMVKPEMESTISEQELEP